MEDKHVVIIKENLRIPEDQITKLDQDYKETPSADLFIASDSKGNLRCIVKVGTHLIDNLILIFFNFENSYVGTV